ncbi:hypothetical protein RE476_05600 [Methanolobus mangrovi]|uniref:Uncharacterized protein n=1 Tax=Methanolobus mangrovi TaxID=3072977 RepID=A0AA51UHJ8_9EURY|nr:hypothetical protein [Methanolobus mangrovi]WMW23301.1 hypothetical protein RE476_05600 [Methanolobus mangrovi]
MLKRKYIVILAILVLGLVVSGCTDNAPQEDKTLSENTAAEELDDNNNASVADVTLGEEMVGITDPEIQDIEEELQELQVLINETDVEEDIVVEEI